jgi:beta-ketodecanoyl-[acyl-carrier-protein] synthase
MNLPEVVISGSGIYTPPFSISNDELVASYNKYATQFNSNNKEEITEGVMDELPLSSSEFIQKASGIKNRYVLDKEGVLDINKMRPTYKERDNEELSLHAEISIKAINQALTQAGKTSKDVDLIIAAASSFPRAYPSLAIEIQHKLGAGGYSFDMNVACSSSTFAIETARNAIASGSANCVVVVNPEITSGHTDFKNRDCHFIFGDLCTALVIENSQHVTPGVQTYKIISSKLCTQFSNAIRNNFGYLIHCDDNVKTDDKLFTQNGRVVFKEVVPMVATLIKDHLKSNDLDPEELKLCCLHQANINMNKLIIKKLFGKEVDSIVAPMILSDYANTGTSGAIAVFHLHRNNFESGQKGIICSFGAGYSVGCIIIEAC